MLLLAPLALVTAALAQPTTGFFHGSLVDALPSASAWPQAASLAFDHLSLSGWRSDGVGGAAGSFAALAAAERASIVADFHARNKTLRVSAFGRGDAPTAAGRDAGAVARALADFTRRNALDGVDVAYGDEAAVADGRALGWLEAFHAALLEALEGYAPDVPGLHEITAASGANATYAPRNTASSGNTTASGSNTTSGGNATQTLGNATATLNTTAVLLTYAAPAAYFAPGTPGSQFAPFLARKAGAVARLLVQFPGPGGGFNYTSAEELFGYADSGAVWKSRRQVAEVLGAGWDEGRVVVQKPLDPAEQGYMTAEDLGRAFCDAGQAVDGLSLSNIDNTTAANDFLLTVRGYECTQEEGAAEA